MPPDHDVAGHLTLELVEQLPPLPKSKPFFSDHNVVPPGMGQLSVYAGENQHVLLHFLDGALVEVPLLQEVNEVTPTARGWITNKVMSYGRLEDIVYTSLAPLLRRCGYYLIHAFAASRDGECVLIVGPSGSGKTTSGLSLLLSGWQLLANDVLIIERRRDEILALPTPGSISIRPASLDVLPALTPLISSRPVMQGKYVMSYGEWTQAGRPDATLATRLFFPQIASGRTTLEPAARAVSLARLMEQSVDRWDKELFAKHMNVLHDLCQQAAPFTLSAGQDVELLHQLIK